MMDRETILHFLKSHKAQLQESYGVEEIGLFGSYARGEATEQSDIDLVVDMPSSFTAFFGLQEYLERMLGKRIDLGMKQKLRAYIHEKIKDEIIYV